MLLHIIHLHFRWYFFVSFDMKFPKCSITNRLLLPPSKDEEWFYSINHGAGDFKNADNTAALLNLYTHLYLTAIKISACMQDTFARATHSAGRPSAARDDRVSCIQDFCPF